MLYALRLEFACSAFVSSRKVKGKTSENENKRGLKQRQKKKVKLLQRSKSRKPSERSDAVKRRLENSRNSASAKDRPYWRKRLRANGRRREGKGRPWKQPRRNASGKKSSRDKRQQLLKVSCGQRNAERLRLAKKSREKQLTKRRQNWRKFAKLRRRRSKSVWPWKDSEWRWRRRVWLVMTKKPKRQRTLLFEREKKREQNHMVAMAGLQIPHSATVVPCQPKAVVVADAAVGDQNALKRPVSDLVLSCAFLKQAEIVTYTKNLEDYGIDTVMDFLQLDEKVFTQELGFKGFHRKKMCDKISEDVVTLPEEGLTVFLKQEMGSGESCRVVKVRVCADACFVFNMICFAGGARIARKRGSEDCFANQKGDRREAATRPDFILIFLSQLLFEQEVDLLRRMKHQNIVGFLGVGALDQVLFLVLERCVLSVRDLFEAKALSSEQLAVAQKVRGREVTIVQELCKGVHYLHVVMDYVHRDLKPANLLLAEEGVLKIIDFGISKDLSDRAFNNTTSGGGGAEGWMLNVGDLGKEGDVFSIALIAFFVLTNGVHPFGPNKTVRTENLARFSRGLFARPRLGNPLWELFVSECLVVDRKARLTIDGCVRHALFWTPTEKLTWFKQVGTRLAPSGWQERQGLVLSAAAPLLQQEFAKKYVDTVADLLRFVRVVSEHGTHKGHRLAAILQRALDLPAGATPTPQNVTGAVELWIPNLLVESLSWI